MKKIDQLHHALLMYSVMSTTIVIVICIQLAAAVGKNNVNYSVSTAWRRVNEIKAEHETDPVRRSIWLKNVDDWQSNLDQH